MTHFWLDQNFILTVTIISSLLDYKKLKYRDGVFSSL